MRNIISGKPLKTVFYLLMALVLPFSGLGCLPDGFMIDQPFLREGDPADIPDLSGIWRSSTTSSEDDNITVDPTEFKNTFMISANNELGFKLILESLGQNNFIAQLEPQTSKEDQTPRLFLLKYTPKQVIFPEFNTDIEQINALATKYGVSISEEGKITEFRSDQDLKLFFIDVANLPLTGENSLFDRI